MPRMRILNPVEADAFDAPPVFTSAQRKRHFDFSAELLALAQGLQTPASRVGFLVACRYFKATRRFFAGHAFHSRDLAYVAQQIEMPPEAMSPAGYPDRTRQRHVPLILAHYGVRAFDPPTARWLVML